MTTRTKNQVQHQLLYRRRPNRCGADAWSAVNGSLMGDADSWLIAHDLYHHLPTDRGTLAEELATLGAEYYVGFEHADTSEAGELPPPGKNALERAAAGIVGMCFDSDKTTASTFRLAVARGGRQVPAPAQEIFLACELSAVAQLREMLEGNDHAPWLRSMEKFATPGLVSSWVARGYLKAKARFPDQVRVRENWHESQRRLNVLTDEAPVDSILRVTRNGYELDFQLEAPAGDRFPRHCRRSGLVWTRRCPSTGRWYEVEHLKALSWWLARGWTRVDDVSSDIEFEELAHV